MSRLALHNRRAVGNSVGGIDSSAGVYEVLVQNWNAGAWGNWIECISSAPYDADVVRIYNIGPDNFAYNGYFQIGAGALGAEQPLTEAFFLSHYGTVNGFVPLYHDFACKIKRGDRVVMRTGGGNGPDSSPGSGRQVALELIGQDLGAGFSVVDTYYKHSNVLTEFEVQVPTPTTDNAFGAWVELAGSVLGKGNAIYMYGRCPDRTGGDGAEKYIFQYGIGPAGSETPIAEVRAGINDWDRWVHVATVNANIPKGERLSVRFMSDSISAHTAYSLYASYCVLR